MKRLELDFAHPRRRFRVADGAWLVAGVLAALTHLSKAAVLQL